MSINYLTQCLVMERILGLATFGVRVRQQIWVVRMLSRTGEFILMSSIQSENKATPRKLQELSPWQLFSELHIGHSGCSLL